MAFPIIAHVPAMYNWDNLSESFKGELLIHEKTIADENMLDYYAWLLQIASWNFDIDWEPKSGTLSLELPLSGKLLTLDTTKDHTDYNQGILRDEVSFLLDQCLAKVSLRRLLAHFHMVEAGHNR